jgi:acyl carrier protein
MADYSRSEIESIVKEIIARRLKIAPEELTGETRLVEDLGRDSLDLIDLVFEFEEVFHIEISNQMLQKIRTVNDIVENLETTLGRQPA